MGLGETPLGIREKAMKCVVMVSTERWLGMHRSVVLGRWIVKGRLEWKHSEAERLRLFRVVYTDSREVGRHVQ